MFYQINLSGEQFLPWTTSNCQFFNSLRAENEVAEVLLLVEIYKAFFSIQMKSVRHQVCLRRRNCDPNPPKDPIKFLQSDPNCFEVKEILKAGSGLFVNRPFKKYEFIINYREKIKAQKRSTDNVYSIETGARDFLVVDASDILDCLARFITDVDPFLVLNCRTIKIYKDSTTSWTIAIFATKSIDTGEELRYIYGPKFAPWRDIKF